MNESGNSRIMGFWYRWFVPGFAYASIALGAYILASLLWTRKPVENKSATYLVTYESNILLTNGVPVGIRHGDIYIHANRLSISSVEDLRRKISEDRPDTQSPVIIVGITKLED